jgi:hypothetical protein
MELERQSEVASGFHPGNRDDAKGITFGPKMPKHNSRVSSRYENALLPIELANSVASLSTYPSAQVLRLFTDVTIKKDVGGQNRM